MRGFRNGNDLRLWCNFSHIELLEQRVSFGHGRGPFPHDNDAHQLFVFYKTHLFAKHLVECIGSAFGSIPHRSHMRSKKKYDTASIFEKILYLFGNRYLK